MLSHKYAIIADFDRCLADTFSPSPNGIGVDEAYEYAIECLFGKYGLKLYKELGGIKNRAPLELIIDILENGDRKSLIEQARKFFQSQRQGLLDQQLVPASKGFPMVWKDDDDWDPTEVITELLVQCKLSYLLEEVGKSFSEGEYQGKKWPLPCLGFLNFFQAIKELNKDQAINIQLAILSSGHDTFINKTFALWDIPWSGLSVTDDDLRGKKYPLEPSERVKPSVDLFNLLHATWIRQQAGSQTDFQIIGHAIATRPRMIYFGDHVKIDGELAVNAGVPFGLFDSEGKILSNGLNGNFFSFSDWNLMAEFFCQEKTKELLRQNKPFQEMIAPFLQGEQI